MPTIGGGLNISTRNLVSLDKTRIFKLYLGIYNMKESTRSEKYICGYAYLGGHVKHSRLEKSVIKA